MAATQQDLISRIASRYGNYTTGNATGGGATSLLDANTLIEPDNAWIGSYLKVLTGFAFGLERLVTAYTQASGLTFAPALSSPISPGDTYELKGVRDGDIKRAIADSVQRAGRDWMEVATDESMSLVVNQQIYDLPADLVSLISVDVYSMQPRSGIGAWRPFSTYEVYGTYGSFHMSRRGWSVIPNMPSATYQMRLNYLRLMHPLTNATDTLGIGDDDERGALDFITEYSLHILHEQAFSRNRTGEDARQHFTLSNTHKAKAESAEARRTPNWGNARVTRMARPKIIG